MKQAQELKKLSTESLTAIKESNSKNIVKKFLERCEGAAKQGRFQANIFMERKDGQLEYKENQNCSDEVLDQDQVCSILKSLGYQIEWKENQNLSTELTLNISWK